MNHPYLNLSDSSIFIGKLVVGTTENCEGNGLLDKNRKIVEIPSRFNGKIIAEIGSSSFYGTGITSIFIPYTIQVIDYAAFGKCSSLTDVRFEEKSRLKEFRLGVFYYCTSLKRIDFPSKVVQIRNSTHWNFFVGAKLECFSFLGTHDFSDLTMIFDSTPDIYVSSKYPSTKFAGHNVEKGGRTCGVSKEHLEDTIQRRNFECSPSNHKRRISFVCYICILIYS